MPPTNPEPIGNPRFLPQHTIRCEDLRIIAAQSRQMMESAAWGTEADIGADTGLQIGEELLPDGFWARLTAPPVNPDPWYSFSEVQDSGDGKTWTPPNAPMQGTENAVEINNNTTIPVPTGPPTLSASLTGVGTLPAQTLFWVVTATWQNNTSGLSFQSPFSPEVSGNPAGQGVDLTWTAPAAVTGFTLTGYQVWRGFFSGGETVLVTSVSSATLTYTDTGATGSSQTPVLGGTAGPVVWMSPLSVTGFLKFFYPFPSGNISYLSANVGSFSLSSSWSNIGTSLTLPANSTWLLQAQINAQIVSSSSSAGDTISCRLYDGSAVVGCPVEFCDAVCDSLTYVDAASLVAVYTAGGSGATVNIQGIVNTSTGSTGTILACGSLAGGQLVGVRL